MLPNIPAVGRIEVHNHPRGIDWIGTGWLIHDNVVVTNRHVAEIFGDSDGTGFLFRPGIDGTPMQARIDFLEEFDNSSSQEFPLFRILNLETGGGPDLAFLRIEPVSGQSLPRPVLVSTVPARPGEHVAVIGYPARDPFFPDQDLMKRIFHDRYDKKRFAPGLVTGTTADRVFHDCSTLGGNSAAVVILLNTGLAVALHFAGTLFRKNHAVPMDVVVSRLEGVLSGRSRPVSGTLPDDFADQTHPQSPVVAVPDAAAASGSPRYIEATIPIRVRLEIGDVISGAASAPVAATPARLPAMDVPTSDGTADPGNDDLIETIEARPEDYRDRVGYDASFTAGRRPVTAAGADEESP